MRAMAPIAEDYQAQLIQNFSSGEIYENDFSLNVEPLYTENITLPTNFFYDPDDPTTLDASMAQFLINETPEIIGFVLQKYEIDVEGNTKKHDNIYIENPRNMRYFID